MSDKTLAPALSAETFAAFIERAAKDPHFDTQKFQVLLQEQRIERRELERHAYNRAMAKVQAQLELVVRDKPNAFLKSFYTSLRSLYETAHPIYTAEGFSISYGTAEPPHPNWIRVTMEIAHKDGYVKERFLDSPIVTTGSQGGRTAMTPVQAILATTTYLRRGLLQMAFNLVPDERILPPEQRLDDDGEHQRRVYDVREEEAEAEEEQAGPVSYPSKQQPAPKTRAKAKANTNGEMIKAFLATINTADLAGPVGGFLAALRARATPLRAESLRRLAKSEHWTTWREAQAEESREALSAALDEAIQHAEGNESGHANADG